MQKGLAADMEGVTKAYTIEDVESFATARSLLKQEGIPGGSSTGTLLAAALRYCREQTTPKRVVSFVCDTGTRYLCKVYNDGWMRDQGLLERRQHHDLRDLIGRRFDDILDRGLTAVVAEHDTFYGLITRYDLLNHLRRTQS